MQKHTKIKLKLLLADIFTSVYQDPCRVHGQLTWCVTSDDQTEYNRKFDYHIQPSAGIHLDVSVYPVRTRSPRCPNYSGSRPSRSRQRSEVHCDQTACYKSRTYVHHRPFRLSQTDDLRRNTDCTPAQA